MLGAKMKELTAFIDIHRVLPIYIG
jgi:hypothetical protein